MFASSRRAALVPLPALEACSSGQQFTLVGSASASTAQPCVDHKGLSEIQALCMSSEELKTKVHGKFAASVL